VEYRNHFIVIVYHAQMIVEIVGPTYFHIGFVFHMEGREYCLEASVSVSHFLDCGKTDPQEVFGVWVVLPKPRVSGPC
jgi:hypothetical protein